MQTRYFSRHRKRRRSSVPSHRDSTFLPSWSIINLMKDLKKTWGETFLPFSGDKKPFPFLKSPFDERDGKFSPDTKWIAYQSDESGRFEIYVRPFQGQGGKFHISTSGGTQPRWNRNGKEIFYLSLDSKMMAVPVKLSPDGQSLEIGTPAALFPVRIALGPLTGPVQAAICRVFRWP